MGRPKKKNGEHRVKFGISIDPVLFDKMGKELISRSKFIEKLVTEYYEKNKRK